MFRLWGMKSAILVLCALIVVALPACAPDVADEPTEVVAEEPTEMPAPTPVPTPVPDPVIYQMGIFAEPISRNYWNYYGGPAGSVWTGTRFERSCQ